MLNHQSEESHIGSSIMSNEVIPDSRVGHWWGIIFPRTLHDKALISQLISFVVGVSALVFGVAISFLQIFTLPLVIALVLAVHVIQGDVRARSARLRSN